MDIFGKKRISELEKKLELASNEIESLKSDVRALERENYELVAQYEPNKGPHIVKSASNAFVRSLGGSKEQRSAEYSNSTPPHSTSSRSVFQSSSSDGLATGALLGVTVAFALSDESTCDSGSSGSDCPTD